MPDVKLTQLKSDLKSENFFKLYILTGESYLVDNFEKLITDKILSNQKNDFTYTLFSEETFDINQFTVALDTMPIGCNKKCIVLKNLPLGSMDAKELNDFIALAKDIPDYAVIIVSQIAELASTKVATKFKKFKKEVLDFASITNFSPNDVPLEKQLISWAKKDFDKVLASNYAKRIIEMCPKSDLTALKNELKKVCEFEQSAEITESALQILCQTQETVKIFDLPKAILQKNRVKAFGLLEKLLKQKEEPTVIVAVIANEFIDIIRVQTALKCGQNANILTEIFDYKSKEFRISNAKRHLANYSEETLSEILKLLIKADADLKSSSIDAKVILSELLVKLMNF